MIDAVSSKFYFLLGKPLHIQDGTRVSWFHGLILTLWAKNKAPSGR